MDNITERLRTMHLSKESRKQSEHVFQEDSNVDNFPQSPVPNIKTNDVAYSLIDRTELSTAYTYFTGRFTIRTYRLSL